MSPPTGLLKRHKKKKQVANSDSTDESEAETMVKDKEMKVSVKVLKALKQDHVDKIRLEGELQASLSLCDTKDAEIVTSLQMTP